VYAGDDIGPWVKASGQLAKWMARGFVRRAARMSSHMLARMGY
jgi:hypothetical protein